MVVVVVLGMCASQTQTQTDRHTRMLSASVSVCLSLSLFLLCMQLEDLTRLPSAHTCFNRLDLPAFPSKSMLQERLRIAMWGAQGFTGD